MLDNYISPDLQDYCYRMSSPEETLLTELQKETYAKTTMPQMLCGRIEGRILKFLVQSLGARYALEIGTFTGYSALSIAEGLASDGRLITCDINKETLAIAESFFRRSPHGHKIRIEHGPALATIGKIPDGLDFVFIDADKQNYKNYYEAVLPKLRSGGMIVIDNALWGGSVLAPQPNDMEAYTIHGTNELISRDERVENVLLSVRDGINIVRKK